MNDQRPDAFMMIGLHKLAAQNGDGLVPELYELLTRRSTAGFRLCLSKFKYDNFYHV